MPEKYPGFAKDVEVLSANYNYEALALELARELKEAKKEIDRLSAILDDVRQQRDELLARAMGRYSH
jgi:hypothetical protein